MKRIHLASVLLALPLLFLPGCTLLEGNQIVGIPLHLREPVDDKLVVFPGRQPQEGQLLFLPGCTPKEDEQLAAKPVIYLYPEEAVYSSRSRRCPSSEPASQAISSGARNRASTVRYCPIRIAGGLLVLAAVLHRPLLDFAYRHGFQTSWQRR